MLHKWTVSISCEELSKVLRSDYKCVQADRLVTKEQGVWDAIILCNLTADSIFELTANVTNKTSI